MKEKTTGQSRTKKSGSVGIGLVSASFACIFGLLGLGTFYLYQVNDLATKGYEIRDVENRIKELEKENKKLEIKEVELRSMYNLEKASRDLDLINSQNVSVLDMNGPMAMK